jgi:hypothetical protein
MLTVRELHDQAMALSMDADVLHQMKAADADRIAAMYADALTLERQAAERISIDPAHEPTRSILYRSAAWMAVKVGDTREAARLAREGLAGFPPASVEAELHDVLSAIEHPAKK